MHAASCHGNEKGVEEITSIFGPIFCHILVLGKRGEERAND